MFGIGAKNQDMVVSTLYLDQLKKSENSIKAGYHGGRWYIHKDPLGIDTIAYGHRVKAKEYGKFRDGLSNDDALGLLLMDCDAHSKGARELKVKLTQGQFDAIVDFTFNAGIGNFIGTGKGTINGKINIAKAFNERGISAGFEEMVKYYVNQANRPSNANNKAGIYARSQKQQAMAGRGVY